MNVFDASALLCYLQGEAGVDVVERALGEGGACGAANWAEVAQQIRAHGRNWDLASALLTSHALRVEPVTVADAEWSARRWTRGKGLSLADRLCLALGERLDAHAVWTTDSAWGTTGRVRQIR